MTGKSDRFRSVEESLAKFRRIYPVLDEDETEYLTDIIRERDRAAMRRGMEIVQARALALAHDWRHRGLANEIRAMDLESLLEAE